MNLNLTILERVVAEAKAKAAGHQRWLNAIDKAARELIENPRIFWNEDEHTLLILSRGSLNTYSANGICQCEAFFYGKPCHHRAAARLIERYLEVERANQVAPTVKAVPAQPAQAERVPPHASAPLVKPSRVANAVTYQGWDI